MLQTIAQEFPDRTGPAVWIDVRKGVKDEGLSFRILQKKQWTVDALLGHVSAGVALGFDVARVGNLVATVYGGVTHPYDLDLVKGWSPVVGVGIRF